MQTPGREQLLFMNATASGALENVLSEDTISNRWSHCISETNLFNFETQVDDCNDNRVKEVRYRFSLVEEEPRITIEHDEYIIKLRNRKPDFANSFTTGPNPRGYALNTIDLSMHSKDCSGVPPKLIIFNGFLVGAGAQHCQGQIRQRDRFATTMTIPTRNGDFGVTRAGSEWPARRAHSTACPNA